MNRVKFAASRILGAVVVLIIIAAACFAIFYLMPTNPAQLSCGKPCSPERLAEVEMLFGCELEPRQLTPTGDLDVRRLVRSHRHILGRQVGQTRQQLVERRR